MDRFIFMKELEALLSDISPSEREEALQYYNDYLNDAGVENEEEVLRSLGTAQDLARVIREGLSDGGERGEFTENGYRNRAFGEEMKQEIARKERAGKGKDGRRAGNGKPLSPGMIALILIMCLIGFPALAGIAAGVIGTGVGILGSILGIVLSVTLAGAVLLAAAVVLAVFGAMTLAAQPLAAICFLGLGILLGGLALFFIWLAVWLWTVAIPWMIRGAWKIGSRLLRGKGVKNV